MRAASDRTSRLIATTALSVGTTAALTGIVLIAMSSMEVAAKVVEAVVRLLSLPYLVIGVMIVRTFPRHRVGWVFVFIGFALTLNDAAFAYATFGLDHHSPGTRWAAWATTWAWLPAFAAIGALFLLFPTGRPPSRRWAVIGWAGAVGTLLGTFANALWDRPIDSFESIRNPLGVAGTAGQVVEFALGIGTTTMFVAIFLSGASLIVRLRRSRGEERQQIKWFAFAAALLAGSLFGMAATYREGAEIPPIAAFFQLTAVLAAIFVAVAAGIAIFKYRLYDIDVIINRALVYAALTAVLAAAYVGMVFTFQTLLAPLRPESDLAVAASTLAVAALFRPMRSRIQLLIDRRFYRRKVDAQRTVEAFNSELRDEVELGAVSRRLVNVVNETMQPDHVSLWLRDEVRA